MNTFDFTQARDLMVEQQIRPWNVLDPRVLEVLGSVPREDYVPQAQRELAYADVTLPLAHGEVIMKPVVQGRALEALQVGPEEDVLEIGTGSGYLTDCLSRMAREVLSIERHADLAEAAQARLVRQGRANVRVQHADAFGFEPGRQFDAICVTGAVTDIPATFLEWLKPNGRMFIVRGHAPAMEAVLVHQQVNAPRIESLFETHVPYLAGAEPVPAFEL
ncbi:protein-L-isoaspartate O-methyltransferase [Lysobacter sp. GX 14042]|uniref:protein-L-isoaspartate O-methyltransferase family protein n=1 Tax=Lysobacter sp. GX 14042 TaxID=2907155 RepID=UPI001F3D79C9|nr:protein-L-isoaspartate O-methyltransferase [Lysobacter sp. GX 14042]MCE7033400.1 protein-L-isoaspartate O-methyltransferase [Lysobacter sp. GX 14042]